MIFTDRTIIVQKGTSSINDIVVLYRGDKEVQIRFALNEGSPFRFNSASSSNIIEKTEAAYGQLIIQTPNDLPSIFSEVAPTNEGKIIFTITGEMIDEIAEVGYYTFQIRLFDENRNSRATLPEVVNGIEIREPIATEVTDTNEAGIATVGYALTTAGTTEDAFDTQGNYNKTTWQTGDRITAQKLNKMETGIDEINKKVASGEIVDLSGYVAKEIGNASQITFSDGETFQDKLNAGTLKGEKGDPGIQGEIGPQGPAGADGQDGLTTSISVNGNTYTHVDGVITLPNYPTLGGSAGGSNSSSDITISDSGNYFTSGNVEGALQEVGSQIKDIKNNYIPFVDVRRYKNLFNDDDITLAIKQIIEDYKTLGVKIQIPIGNYEISSTIEISNSAITINGMGIYSTILTSTITDGSPMFYFKGNRDNKPRGNGISNLRLNGVDKLSTKKAIKIEYISFATFNELMIDRFGYGGIDITEMMDSDFYRIVVRDCGNLENSYINDRHAIYVYNGLYDNSNRLTFTNCQFESNEGSHFYSDSSGNSRINGQISFVCCKFHGKVSVDLNAAPATPAIYLHGDTFNIVNCMFYFANDNFIYIKGGKFNSIVGGNFRVCNKYFIEMDDTSENNSVIGISGNHYGSNKSAIKKNDKLNNFISFSDGSPRKLNFGINSIGENTGRLALWANMYRDNAEGWKQVDGSKYSYAMTVDQGNAGYEFSGGENTGTDGTAPTMQQLFHIRMSDILFKRNAKFVGGNWNTPHIELGNYHIWVSDDGVLRIKNGAPESSTDGTIVGSQG